MMKHPRLILFSVLIVLSGLLTACSGQALESWPGFTADPQSQMVFLSYGPHIYQLNLTNGAEVWRYPSKADAKVNFYAPPTLASEEELLVGGYNHLFYSLKPGSDQPNWSFAGAKDRFIAAALVVGDVVYAPCADGRLYALDRNNGNLLWDFQTGHSLWSTPVVDGEKLYLASMDHHIYALNVQSGREIWRTEDLGGQIVAAPTLGPDGTLYSAIFGSKTDDPARSSQLVALDSTTGGVKWKLPIVGWVWSSPLLHEGVLYFGDTAGVFYAVDAEKGALLWKYQPADPPANHSIIGAPSLVGDAIMFGSKSGVLYALSAADGSLLWEKPIGGQLYSNLTTVGDLTLFAPLNLESAVLLAVDQDGNIRWQFAPQKK
jgi:outer membrane protein assembly factor BamB